MNELRSRRAMGVDVSRETSELLEYSSKHPELKTEFLAVTSNGLTHGASRIRRLAVAVGLRHVRRRLRAAKQRWKIGRGDVKAGFVASGNEYGFHDAAGCADFVSMVARQ
jgi:hypothetical protein